MAPPHVRTTPATSRSPVRNAFAAAASAGLAGSLCALLSLSPLAAQPARATGTGFTEAGFEEQVLFKAGPETADGDVYSCFRIPALVTTVRGTVLAFAEGRKGNCGDATDIDVVVKRSADGGRTWSPLEVVDEGRGDTHGNPAPVVDRSSGRITLLTTDNRGRPDAGNCDVPCDRTPHVQHSDDDGAHWSEPEDLTRELRPPGWNSWYATGPGHGIQLAHGPHRGRLVVGLNAETHDGARGHANHAALALSDDGGAHWRLGAVDTHAAAPDGTYAQKPSELTLAERADGTVYAGGREQDGTELGNRDFAVSPDGGTEFAGPFRAVPDLYTPMVQGSVAVLRPGRWLFASPADPDRRRSMTIRSSYDEGRTWEGVERGRLVTADWAGYSDMAVVDGEAGTTGLLYEAGRGNARDEIRFARFTEDWLGPRSGPFPTTPDRAPGARDAYVLGGPRPVRGRSGGGLAFDGVDDAVRLPYRASLPLGTRDFTVVLWFRSSAARSTATGSLSARPTANGPLPALPAAGGPLSARPADAWSSAAPPSAPPSSAAAQTEQPLLWMGGMGGAPQVALRVAPGGRVTGQVTAVAGAGPARTAVVRSAAYGDGLWHRVVLRRGGGRIVLTVDGAASSVPGVPGTVSRNSTFGVHLGQRPDGRAWLSGELDDVRVYGRALTDGEVARLGRPVRPGEPALSRDLLLWLPLDRVDRAQAARESDGSAGSGSGAATRP
ncbi:exo-alpha-sialidase [Streptomyces roseoverticillatus]|uniref:exo-alpha-sialidase n=1 Tax=Streptomyces roseoverticillatus TaxID=66429 RepID=UPI001F1FC438|nr:exo-alpha-sialidase [Streptomyces roseoverticillatus]MCF3102605.1 exo-alpha-sialidase [Streptomyces roseoverticillatus]